MSKEKTRCQRSGSVTVLGIHNCRNKYQKSTDLRSKYPKTNVFSSTSSLTSLLIATHLIFSPWGGGGGGGVIQISSDGDDRMGVKISQLINAIVEKSIE